MRKLSLVMIVKNEEKVLARCLDSVKHLVDEMIVADTGSTDDTKKIAHAYGAKVCDYVWEDDFAKARNFALSYAAGDWNLILDADEVFTQGTKESIQRFMEQSEAIGRIKVVSKIKQDHEIRTSSTWVSRLIPKGIYFEGRVHEQIKSNLPRVNTEIEVNHDGYYETDKTGRNLRLLLLELDNHPSDPYLLYQTAKQYKLSGQYQTANDYFEKCYQFLGRNAGYRDLVVIDYLYNILATGRLFKGIGMIEKERAQFADYPDFHFVCALFYMELVFSDVNKYIHLFPEIEREYKTCLRLGETDKYSTMTGTGSFLAAYNLGVYYETTGDMVKAKEFYTRARSEGYEPALTRIADLKPGI
ncbi:MULTISPECIES: glycosyltransferase family 2 protein [unclassified Dehalobacter]|uniref:glycosyltransferase family 2 protein n=1 Tax=unclassified Dehalobacter TaxID=2635733 RepID=UPI0003606479|nr:MULTISPECIES: glycosyltransferase family 2 protein [unclassified Dehalobacter]RJE48787.1 glycosyl transferase family 2 [Dehalobacter sp. MCB1]TCX51878.1 glycosyltransferase family 2 protein [Dehalobacter sp. 14DCB1]TCX52938.1 glycosyltransferase family 2 protein [Dehalobacter sp. 12DCB1]